MTAIRRQARVGEQENADSLPQTPQGDFADHPSETTGLFQTAHFQVGQAEPRERHRCVAQGQG